MFEHYNYKKGVYEVRTDSTIAEGTEITVTVRGESNEPTLAAAEAAVEDQTLRLAFADAQGQAYAPPREQEAYFEYSWNDREGNPHSFYHSVYRVAWYNYHEYTGDIVTGVRSNTFCYQESGTRQMDIDVAFKKESVRADQGLEVSIGDSKVTLSESTETADGYIRYIGQWKGDTGLREGFSSINYSQDGRNLYTETLIVYDADKFYMSSQEVTRTVGTDNGLAVRFGSQKLYGDYVNKHNKNVTAAEALREWQEGAYQLELFDRGKNPVTGFSVASAAWSDNYFTIYMKDVPAKYTGFYVRVTKAGKTGVNLSNGNLYYDMVYDGDEQYGIWQSVAGNDSDIRFKARSSNDTNENAYIGVEASGTEYPLTVTITRPWETDPVVSFTAAEPSDGLRSYEFTEDDVSGTKPDEAYRLTARSATGRTRVQTGYVRWGRKGKPPVEAVGVTLDHTSLDLQVGQTKNLTAVVQPADASQKVTWSSSDGTVASVDAAGRVTALKTGTAVITAAVVGKEDTLKAECEVVVRDVTQKPAEIPAGLTALTNEQRKLGDVKLPEGWKWSYPNEELKQFAGAQRKYFAAEYTESAAGDKEPYRTQLPVSITTVTGMTVGMADGGKAIGENSTAALLVTWKCDGAPMDFTSYEKKIVWSSSKESVAAVTRADNAESVALQAKSAGKAVITAKMTFAGNKTYQAKYEVTVTKEPAAQITAVSVEGFTADAEQSVHQGTVEMKNTTMQVSMTGADRLTVKSNNAKVVSPGKVTAAGGQYRIPLTVKAAGAAEITLTASDEAKTIRTVRLEVTDPVPQISESSLTVNLQQTTGTAFYLYPNEGCTVESAALDGEAASSFELHADGNDGYTIFAKENTAKGSYKLSLKGVASCKGQEKSYSGVALTVKVVDTKPKYKVKQSGKVNVFYKNAKGGLAITSEETLESAALSGGCDFTLQQGEDGAYELTAEKSGGRPADYSTQGKLTLRFAGYKPIETSLKIAVENKKPKVSLDSKSVTLYPAMGLDSARIGVKADGKSYIPASGSVSIEKAERFTIAADGGKLLLRGAGLEDKNTSVNAAIKIQDNTWSEAVSLSFKIKTKQGSPVVGLQKKSLQLNANDQTWAYDTAATAVMWKDGAVFEPEAVTVKSADGRTEDILFDYDRENRQITARLNRKLSQGTYKFDVQVKVTEKITVSAPLSVKIVDVQKDKAVKISAKGNIDVLNRAGSFVTVTPSLKSLNGTVADASLTGQAAHLFRAECEGGKIKIYAKEDMALITRYPYKVKVNLKLENAGGARMNYTTSDVTLKLKQTKPKVTLAPKNATFFSGVYNSADRKITAVIKGVQDPVIEKVELVNNQSAFDCDYRDGTVTLQSTKGAVKGKNYSLQFKITCKGQADNEKAVTVKYTVKVK